ncbi:MAG: lecithin retinol acyltransferase family protein [Bacteroidales bacterium]|nr:lecithin retinol acyltransferase family protein [Bacteroidales bacterium]
MDINFNKLKELAENAGNKMKGLAESAGILTAKPELSYPQRGDVIFAVRNIKILWGKVTLPNLYYHYGVYVGNGEVIHFNDPDPEHTTKSKAQIIKTSLNVFADGDTVFIEPIDEETPHNTNEQTAQKAEEMLKCPRNYNVAINNCEHFANECRYNRKKSSQMSKFIKILLPSIIVNVPRVVPLPPYIKIPASIITLVAEHFLTNKGKSAHFKQIKNPRQV